MYHCAHEYSNSDLDKEKLNNNNLLRRAGNSKTGGVNYRLLLGCPFLHTYERVITPGIALPTAQQYNAPRVGFYKSFGVINK